MHRISQSMQNLGTAYVKVLNLSKILEMGLIPTRELEEVEENTPKLVAMLNASSMSGILG